MPEKEDNVRSVMSSTLECLLREMTDVRFLSVLKQVGFGFSEINQKTGGGLVFTTKI